VYLLHDLCNLAIDLAQHQQSWKRIDEHWQTQHLPTSCQNGLNRRARCAKIPVQETRVL